MFGANTKKNTRMEQQPSVSVSGELKSFMVSGIYRLDRSNVVFVDPVRLLNESYSRYRLSPPTYYSRRFYSHPRRNGELKLELESESETAATILEKKRKRKRRENTKHHDLNERELLAERRHQGIRHLLLSAHEAILDATDLLDFLPKIIENEDSLINEKGGAEIDFIEIGNQWKASFYEISLSYKMEKDVLGLVQNEQRRLVPLFNNIISVEANDDTEAEFQNNRYIIPSRSSFLMSDLRQVRDLIPAEPSKGFNLIVVDPPWENASVRQKAMYPTLPNRYFLYLPVKELAHADGALVALWVTNREKLQVFVEQELFPAWGVTAVTRFYWLKVKPDGSLISDLDLFHHRPYECLFLGYVNMDFDRGSNKTFKYLKESQVVVSIPGAYSRKPPLAKLLSAQIPGPKPSKCVELFARELVSGWTSWGNEPLHFQNSTYFLEK